MRRFAASMARKPSEVPSGAYNGIFSRLEDTLVVWIEGKEFIESPVSRARPQLTSIEYQARNSVVNSKVGRPRRSRGRWARWASSLYGNEMLSSQEDDDTREKRCPRCPSSPPP